MALVEAAPVFTAHPPTSWHITGPQQINVVDVLVAGEA
jgi:hypothetical protein